LPERVKRQYRYVQDIPRPPTDVLSMRASHIPHAFIDFRPHTIKEESWGEPTGDIPMAVRGWIYAMVQTGVSP